MDCNSCHNVHKKEAGNLTLFSQRCMTCHTAARHNECKLLPKLGNAIKGNCIDCHMPAKPSNLIQVEAAGNKLQVPYEVRTHRIAIYPQETKKVMAFIDNFSKAK
jgi:uncharacterized membrane protein